MLHDKIDKQQRLLFMKWNRGAPMSTLVVKSVPRRARRSADAKREEVVRVALSIFSRAGYDAVGLREIAAAAEIDAAMIVRLFGSKAGLFTAVISQAFGDEPLLDSPIDELGALLAAYLTAPREPEREETEPNDLLLLLRSAASVTAAPLLSVALHEKFIGGLAKHFTGPDREVRAALIAAQVLGFATLRFALGSELFENGPQDRTRQLLAAAIQSVIEG
ncbi:TetR family transcriptional regulator [Sphingomonas sp. BIUV-7]|uniref:TetR family transcriptional regulator n=1 Tax=Sphingomonas natans TaxID=3063330 RepID=A0ABT8YCH0_9SPHN|nr:TetR family transcriptional regulator [Sphingomonas sp. BIUV-7]MDO6415394.1 TetR family transcriptional regulator [Sphingomonas sp. BIUV-7]